MTHATLERATPALPATTNTPVQLGFLDAPTEPPALRVAVIGVLQRQAEVRISGDGRCHVYVQVLQAGNGPPFVAMHHMPAECRPELERLCAALLPGTAVLLRGEGLAITHHQGREAFELLRCESVNPIEFDQPGAETP